MNLKNWLYIPLLVSCFLIFAPYANADTYFSDNFDAGFGDLAGHTPSTVGTSWSISILNTIHLYVQSYNRYVTPQANATNQGSLYVANGTYSTADYEVTANVMFSGGSSDYTRTLAARVQDANNMYALRFSSNVFQIYKRVSGTWTLLGSQTSTLPQGNISSPYIGDEVGLKVLGNEISGSVNGTTVLTVTDSSISAAGKAGLGIGYVIVATDDAGTGVGVDNFVVESVTSDVTAPTISTLSPADDETSVELDSNLVITFDEAVDVESGNITIYKSVDDSEFEVIDVTSGNVTGTGTDTITINPDSDFDSNTQYYVQIDATAFDDPSSNSFAGISDTTTWNFTTLSTGSSLSLKYETRPNKPKLQIYLINDYAIKLGILYDADRVVTNKLGFITDDGESVTETTIIDSVFWRETSSNRYIYDLKCGENYKFKAFASNNLGTVYSDEVEITTKDCVSVSGDENVIDANDKELIKQLEAQIEKLMQEILVILTRKLSGF